MTTTLGSTVPAQPSAPPTRAVTSWRSTEAAWHVEAEPRLVPLADVDSVLDQALSSRVESTAPVLGALPFAPDAAAVLLAPIADLGSATSVHGPDPVHLTPVRAEESAQRYRAGVRSLLDLIGQGVLEKAVLARRVLFHSDAPMRPEVVFAALDAAHPLTYRFDLPLPTGGSLLGASPELLIRKSGRQIRSHPLAGSAARQVDLGRDEQAARQLVASEKDQREHAHVVEAIADALAPYCRQLAVPRSPALVATHTLWHLGTLITGELKDEVSSLELARALHPTPAVGGTPRREAVDRILELEDFDRGYYAGAVGWCDEHGDGEWAVAIRCAHVEGDRITAYAGAGIVDGSDADAEVAETSTKMRAFLDAVGEVDR